MRGTGKKIREEVKKSGSRGEGVSGKVVSEKNKKVRERDESK